MKRKLNSILPVLGVGAVLASSVPVQAQTTFAEDAGAALSTGIGEILTTGGPIAIAGLGIFVAIMTVRTIKRFFSAGK